MPSRKRKTTKKKPALVGMFLPAFLLVALIAAAWAGWQCFIPFGPSAETFVDLPPGSSSIQIARQLQDSGIVRSQFAFDLLRLYKRGTLRAGEYRFDHAAPLTQVYARIARGDVFTLAVTIPEGATIFDIALRLQLAGLGSSQDFITAANQQVSLIADLDPAATSIEGYLFPDTYRFARRTSPNLIAAVMVHRFRAVASQLGLTHDLHRVVTLASLVERETAVDSERRLVASVFENRLAKNMPLMSDPTVIYGLQLEGAWHGVFHPSDLTRNTAYNTYIHPGLPPGPVANPGARSLRAAMDPAQTDYLYFVAAGADPQGHSLFARTLDEHNHNVAGYRHALKKAGGR
jgi:UPF0755 protein